MSSSYHWNHNFSQIARESGFLLREVSNGLPNWRYIASFDIDRLIKDQDFERLDAIIPHLSDAPLGTILNNSILDPAVAKYFGLAQLGLQYLLFCLDFLDKTTKTLRNAVYENQKENLKLQKICSKRNDELLHVHKKLQKLETEYVQNTKQIYSCTKCTKNFGSSEFLNGHMKRKHSTDDNVRQDKQNYGYKVSVEQDKNLINAIKLELEIKQLKERLNVTEKELTDQKLIANSNNLKTTNFHSIAIQSNLEETKDTDDVEAEARAENNCRSKTKSNVKESEIGEILKTQMVLLDNWKLEEHERVSEEIDKIKTKLNEMSEVIERKNKIPQLRQICMETISIPSDDVRGNPYQQKLDEIIKNEAEKWKTKYDELEKMYQENQQKLNAALVNIDRKYEEKIQSVESLIEKVNKENIKQGADGESVKVENRQENKCSESLLQPRLKTNRISMLGRSKTFDFPSAESSSEETESNDESEIIEEIKNKLEKDNSMLEITHKASDNNLSDIEINKDQKKVTFSGQFTKTIITSQKIPKVRIIEKMKSRLAAVGIDPKMKGIPTSTAKVTFTNFLQQRESQKNKWHNFMGTRSKLEARVDELAKAKLYKSKIPISSVLNLQVRRPKRLSFVIPETKDAAKDNIFLNDGLKENILKPEMFSSQEEKYIFAPITELSVENITEKKNSIEIQAKENKEINGNKSLLDGTENSKLSMCNIDSKSMYLIENSSDISENDIKNSLEIKPKPVPRKRVIFNLDEKILQNKINEKKGYDLSDWDISSIEG